MNYPKTAAGTATLIALAVAVGSVATSASASAEAPAAIGATVAVAAARASAARPPIVYDPIPFGAKRKNQMAAYAQRHYGVYTSSFGIPKQVILHYTVSPTYSSTWNWMAANAAAGGNAGTKKEKPGACTHFVIAKNGTIYQLAPLDVMCRHVVGLNNQAIGIEFVEMKSARNILRRKKQVAAGRALVRWLQSEYGIAKRDVIGHAMANKSRFFYDRLGWFNDHDDWPTSHVKIFRRGIL